MQYKVYVTKSLQLNPENKYLTKNYVDIIFGINEKPIDGDAIAEDIILRAGLKVGDTDECV